ncbi:hypothetical protein JOD29_000016 [Lysinibacillus composti]|uniref:Uncharacterized protein n=1 Tax=Lysinibacillus composti TaxID=720633 RepID=A0A3N9UL08_9BACI|nr:hypothetical protein [Lysinibacillus composti]MBM7606779.1 hypothetical protein [Lysinibacillus composti]RQW76607.1 hypothetical protein EBB45_03390 [Lysinibacillus composti]
MLNNRKNLYWVLSVLILITAPIIVLLTPIVVTSILFDNQEKIAIITYSKSFIMYGLAFGVAFITLLFLYFIKSIFVKIFFSLFAIFSFIQLYSLGTGYYVYFDENYIEYNPLFGEKTIYQWDEITNVVHETYNEQTNEAEKYIFQFQNGSSLEIIPTSTLDVKVKEQLYNKILETEASYEEY